MTSYDSVVAFAPLRSSLVNLPPSIVSLLNNSYVAIQNVVIQFDSPKSGRKGFSGWTGFASTKHDVKPTSFVELDPAFAGSIGISDGDKVRLTVHANPPEAQVVHLEPVTAEDWEMVDLHSQYLESGMLAQVRTVSLDQKLVVYMGQNVTASLNVTKIEPVFVDGLGCAKLGANVEIVVAPKMKDKAKPVQKSSVGGSSRIREARDAANAIMLKGVAIPHCIFTDSDVDNSADDTKLAIYVDRETVFPVVKTAIYAYVSVSRPALLMPVTKQQLEQAEQTQHECAKKVVAEIISSACVLDGYVGLSPRLALALNVAGSVGFIVRLEQAPKPLSRPPRTLFVVPFSDRVNTKAQFKNGTGRAQEVADLLHDKGVFSAPVVNYLRVPAFAGTVLPFGGMIEFDRADGWMPPMKSSPKIEWKTEKERPSEEDLMGFMVPVAQTTRMRGVDFELDRILRAVERGSGVLLSGARGSGKRTMLDHVRQYLYSNLIYSFTVSCADLTDERVTVVKDTLMRWFARATWHAPSVMILTDLESIVPEETEHADASRTRQLCEMMVQMCGRAGGKVAVLATAESKVKVHEGLTNGHVVEEHIELKAPDKVSRKEILTDVISRIGMEFDKLDLLDLADRMDGYLPGDIMTVTERAEHERLIRGSGALSQSDFDNALDGFVPASLRGVNLQQSSVAWGDVGGLAATKRVLLETLEWPTKYAPVFANCPLRLRSGVLLYGYPGCGKTFLASAVAHECGLNFISIKGPELLNKYIGASEKSVRDLFARAQAARPCVLFFDEFDSIAPKRGHDSTGVTDRVVNQMLTEMDGAEGLDGVYVLAATSRPDLIDSALLRPGRIDKSVLCGMPDWDERVDILKVLSRKMKVGDDVDFEDVAHATEGFTGADLQAVMYNAHLDAIKELIESETEDVRIEAAGEVEYFQVMLDAVNRREQDPGMRTRLMDLLPTATTAKISRTHDRKEIIIEDKNMRESLRTTRPSTSRKELIRLSAIYDEFVSGRSGEMPNGLASTDVGGRATL
ncbi:P-loop containing nucleoside triphosphate hydrolase protein, partial [Lipomyces arxii]|uniref:P-loop containing nucleoside triphosphate hydrolase protein n=1 Tax=Lipomyces arxii TaxID=56418 RepID=UPI0034CD8483